MNETTNADSPQITTAVLKLDSLVLDPRAQPREKLNEEVIDEYAEAIKEGTILPPMEVFRGEDGDVLADGFHRYNSLKKAGFSEGTCHVRPGNMRDAILYSVGANANHGLRRTPKDRLRAITSLLVDPEWGKWSDREIARRTNTSRKYVAKAREWLEEQGKPQPKTRKTVRKGKEVEFDPKRINKKRQAERAEKKAEKAAAVEREEAQTFGEIMCELVRGDRPTVKAVTKEIVETGNVPHQSFWINFARYIEQIAFELGEDQTGVAAE